MMADDILAGIYSLLIILAIKPTYIMNPANDNSRIKDASRKVADKVLRSDSLIFTFLRSVVSSQAASCPT